MSANYVTFKKFPDAQSARALQQFLIDNGIECLFADTSPHTGAAISGEYNKEFEVQLRPENFQTAENLLEKHAEGQISSLPKDYYLLTFSDEELQDVVLKHDEWSEFDYVLARKLLAERGQVIDETHLHQMRQKRTDELAKPDGLHWGWIVAGYNASLAGGFFGFMTGYVLMTSKKTLPNGQTVPTYSRSVRGHARIMLITGFCVLAITITLLIVN